jgi:hypothetical protein
MSHRRIDASVMVPLKEALTSAFWYKSDLRDFVQSALDDGSVPSRINWEGQYKRMSVSQLVDYLHQNQHKHFGDLLSLTLSTADLPDPHHLRRLDDGEAKYEWAADAIATLRDHVDPLRKWRDEAEEVARRRDAELQRQHDRRAMSERIEELRGEYVRLLSLSPQDRGYAVEKVLKRLFEIFDIETKGSFRIDGEQIDGAFTFETWDFLLESKWQRALVDRADLDTFAAKVARKLDNTLGLFVAINGFQASAIRAHSSSRPSILLMDGRDLMAILEERIYLPELLRRKRKHASQTGDIYCSVEQLLG